MITINKYNENSNATHMELVGLSTDEKPIAVAENNTVIGNGSTFFAMDTGDVFIYDAENKIWHLI